MKRRQSNTNISNNVSGKPLNLIQSSLLPLTAAAALLLAAGAVQAAVLEEVVVSAQKRDQDVQDVGIAITAFTGPQMRAFGVKQSFDLATMSPGVHISGNLAGQNTQFTIRGVTQNDFNDIVEAPVAVYIDEGYLAVAQAQTFGVYDLERAEILKGPQGTLFGRNATGGLVNYITRKPNLEGADGYVDVTVGRFDTDADANSLRLEAATGMPFSDTAAGRVAVLYNKHDGYLNNLYPLDEFGQANFGASNSNSPGAGAGADMGDDDTLAGRLSFLFQPNEDVSLHIMGNAARSKVATGPYQSKSTIGVLDPSGELVNVIDTAANETRASIAADGSDGGSDQGNSGMLGFPFGRPVPGGDFFGYIDPDGEDFNTSGDFAFSDSGETKTRGLYAKLGWDVRDNMTFTSVTDYKKYEKLLFIDVDSAPVNQLANYAAVDADSFTQELRMNGETSNMRWVGGLYYLKIDSESKNGLKGPENSLPVLFGGFPPSGVDIGVEARLKTDSYSLFGQIEYDISDALTVIAGLRGTREEKDFVMDQPFFASTGPRTIHDGQLLFSARPSPFADTNDDTFWTGKLQLDWRSSEDMLWYAGVHRGVKAASFNAPIPGGLPFPDSALPYDKETLSTVEVGFKSTIMGGRTRINASAFYYDYKDYQAFLFTGVSGVVVNADADNKGVELEVQSSPTDALDLLLNVSLYDATVKDVPLRIGTPLPPIDVNPTYSPEFQVSGLARYQWPAFNGTMSLQGDFSYSDEYFYNLRNFDADKFDSYFLLNARLAWVNDAGNWETALMLRNITDERAGIQGFDLATLCGCNEISFREPRWLGVNVRFSFQ